MDLSACEKKLYLEPAAFPPAVTEAAAVCRRNLARSDYPTSAPHFQPDISIATQWDRRRAQSHLLQSTTIIDYYYLTIHSATINQRHHELVPTAQFPPWRNWLARLTVIPHPA
jgi:hypothetical protein